MLRLMRARDRNSYLNRALRDVMRANHRLARADTYADPIVRLIAQRCSESALQAVRFRYRMPSTWDALYGR